MLFTVSILPTGRPLEIRQAKCQTARIGWFSPIPIATVRASKLRASVVAKGIDCPSFGQRQTRSNLIATIDIVETLASSPKVAARLHLGKLEGDLARIDEPMNRPDGGRPTHSRVQC